ncbi:hypothetical protein N665_0032s0021 [Sinapis alba]|nr:hypothetical protein N665_0032s0021 [Sinapis alba]
MGQYEKEISEISPLKSLVDTGSSVNVIYIDTLDKIELTDPNIRQSRKALIGFNGSSHSPFTTITLLIYVRGVMLDTKFTIIESPDMYNIILGTPWKHVIRGIPSTYHQCIKFTTIEA